MLISDIIPYERNARHNVKAIPVVADSIKEFGLRGTIGLESRENPVIVFGHTRVAACKSLGWNEIPDEKIEYCDDLSEDQIKAFRLADNRTGEVATWNKALLKNEVASLGSKLDMSRYGFDFKSKVKPYGAEMLRNNDVWHLDLCNRYDCAGKWELPPLKPVDAKPADLISFNFCKSASDFTPGVHFCIDDYQFERVWRSPQNYIELLRKFDCVVCPDFSIYTDMPLPMKLWNIYRSRALGYWWQQQGLTVIPNVTWSDESSFCYCFDGIPKGGTVFVSMVGMTSDGETRDSVVADFPLMLKKTKPSRILLLGTMPDFDFGKVDVVNYKPKSFVKRKKDG